MHSALSAAEISEIARISDLASCIRQLEEAIAARDDLISLIGHELRNPLSPVFLQACHLLTEVKKKQEDGGAVPAEWLTPRLELFLRGLDRLLDRLNRLMDVAALQSHGGIAMVEEDVDLAEVVAEVVASLAREAQLAGCSLRLSSPGVVIGRWDRVRLDQIAANLVSNAIRYGGGAPIEIDIEAQPASALLSVRDHGPGIEPDLQSRIFDRFEQLCPRPQRGGLGLGLWITRRLCEAMGGNVVLHSEPGRGAAFVVTLPRGQFDTDD